MNEPKLFSCLVLASALAGGFLTACDDDAADELDRSTSLQNSSLRNASTADSNSRLYSEATYELAVGYSYDIRAEWGKGVRYQIFDIIDLDQRQLADNADYVCDDLHRVSEQEVVTADNETDLTTTFTLSGSIGLSIEVADAKVSGSYTQTDIKSRKYSYGMLRATESVFTRELQYDNVLANASAAKEKTGYFTPVFREDWEDLEKCNSEDVSYETLQAKVKNFLDRWGIAFVCRASMGGYLQYKMTIEKAYLTEGFSVEGALEAELAKVVKGKAEMKYEERRKQISGHYSEEVTAVGGDVQLISIVNSTDSIGTENYKAWSNSFHFNEGLLVDNCVLSDLKLVSIAYLFDGAARTEMEKQIKEFQFE